MWSLCLILMKLLYKPDMQVIEWQLNEKVRKKNHQPQHDKSNQFTIHTQQRFFPLHNTNSINLCVILNLLLSSSKTSITDEHHLLHASIKLLTASRTFRKEYLIIPSFDSSFGNCNYLLKYCIICCSNWHTV